MIDTHCHLLPGIDDGPRNSYEATELGRGLVESGVRMVVCTPHFSRRFPTRHDVATERLEALARALEEAGVRLPLALAAEFGSAAAVEAGEAELRQRQLGNGYVLVELEPDTPAGLVDVAVTRLGDMGLVPVFAHPERCRAVRVQPRLLDAARASGALVQVVAASLVGDRRNSVTVAAWQLLESGRADLLASDSHRVHHARERLTRALQLVTAHLGSQAVTELTEVGPARVISHQAVQ